MTASTAESTTHSAVCFKKQSMTVSTGEAVGTKYQKERDRTVSQAGEGVTA